MNKFVSGIGEVAMSDAEAAAFLAQQTQDNSRDLLVYASNLRLQKQVGGISVNVAASGSPPQMVEASTDPASLVLLHGAVTVAAANPSQTFQWVPDTGLPVTLSAAQINTMFSAVSGFLQATFATLSGIISAINAGTITSTAQIDSPPAPIPAWPANS